MKPSQAPIAINLLVKELEDQKEINDDLVQKRNNLYTQLEKQREKMSSFKTGTAEELFKTLGGEKSEN